MPGGMSASMMACDKGPWGSSSSLLSGEKEICCSGGYGGPGRTERSSGSTTTRYFPCSCPQGVFALDARECDRVSPCQRAGPSLMRGVARLVGERDFERRPAYVSAGEIGDVPLSDEEEENEASYVFRGLSENLRVSLISPLGEKIK